jgi:hypothetical protein
MPSKKKPPPIVPEVDEDAGVLDELHAWYLGMAARDGVVYTWVLRQLVNKLYRDRDYLEKRQLHERRTSYDWAVERDQVALASLTSRCAADPKAGRDPPSSAS